MPALQTCLLTHSHASKHATLPAAGRMDVGGDGVAAGVALCCRLCAVHIAGLRGARGRAARSGGRGRGHLTGVCGS